MSVITPAASVLLSRGPGSRDVFSILRGPHLKFFGGFWAFPGGKLAASDAAPGALDSAAALQTRRIAACRELFEETGVLIARRADGAFPKNCDDLDRCRRALLDERLCFTTMLSERQLTIHEADLPLIGEITTPSFAAVRYATTFFVGHVPAEQAPTVWPGELADGEWIEVARMLARWRRGDAFLTPPTAMTLQTLGEAPIDEAPRLLGPLFARLSHGAEHPIYFAPCVRMIPLRTAALAPSTHTNAYLVGSGPCYLIDPGAEEPEEQARLFAVLDEADVRPDAIVLTHHHRDHVGAAAACAERFAAPIWAHARTAERLQGRLTIGRRLREGDRLDLGPCPADGRPWHLDVLFTPGHASGHLCFLDSHYGLVFAGDMVSPLSSMVIAPPDGDLAVYLQSLCRLGSLPCRILLPAHGNATTQPGRLIDDTLEHRARRERQLLDALAEGPTTIDDMTARLYRGTPEALLRFARVQVLAGLLKLEAEGRARSRADERWQLA